MIQQYEIVLNQYKRGFHLITNEIILKIDLQGIEADLLNIFVKHPSASLTVSENADPTVRVDFERHFNKFVPENASTYILRSLMAKFGMKVLLIKEQRL